MKIYTELESLGFFTWLKETHNLWDTDMKPAYLNELPLGDIHRTVCNSMALRWFREKYNLHVNKTGNNYYTSFNMTEPKIEVLSFVRHTDTENHYEEAELVCLIKLMEMVKIN